MASVAYASIFGRVKGLVHDPQHCPTRAAEVTGRAAHSDLSFKTMTDADGQSALFRCARRGLWCHHFGVRFATRQAVLTLASDTSPILHFELQIGSVDEKVSVDATSNVANVNTVTPTILIDRTTIAQTPGADRTNSMAIVTDYLPGVHDA